MEQHYRTIQRVEEVAAHLGISHSHLRHLFSRYYRTSLVQALTKIRLAHVGRLLRNSTLPLSAVAARCGFRSEQYLCEVFRRHFGCTPGSYRRQHR